MKIALINKKGGVGKTTTTANLGFGLAMQGKKVLMVDSDGQGNLTQMLGWQQNGSLPFTLSTAMEYLIAEKSFQPTEGILHHAEGVDLLPANQELAATEASLNNLIGRETVLREYLTLVEPEYDYILIDCASSLGLMTINALTAADQIIVPIVPEFLPAMGLTELLQTAGRTKKYLNPKLDIAGILLTMVDGRTNFTRNMTVEIRKAHGSRVFQTYIPKSIRVAEASATGQSIYQYDSKGKAARAYANLTLEVLGFEKQRSKGRVGQVR